MRLVPPPSTRVILVPSDGRSSREYVLGRAVVVLLLLSVLLLALAVGLVLGSWPGLQRRAAAADSLVAAAAAAPRFDRELVELQQELARMQDLQERLLYLLGAGGLTSDEADSIRAATAALGPPPPDLWPVGGYVTQEFSPEAAAGGRVGHGGMDLAAPEGAAIRAAGAGLVERAEQDEGLGNFVEIRHGFGYITIYGHCARLAVRPGERVERGQVIGFVGRTGRASAPHLHFEVWKDGEAVDPRGIIPGDPPR